MIKDGTLKNTKPDIRLHETSLRQSYTLPGESRVQCVATAAWPYTLP